MYVHTPFSVKFCLIPILPFSILQPKVVWKRVWGRAFILSLLPSCIRHDEIVIAEERSLRLRSAWLISAPVRSAKILWYLDKSRLVIAYLAHDYRLVVISCLLRFVISVQAFSAAQYSHKLRGVSSGRLIFISFWRILSLCKVEWFTPYHIFFVITAAVSIPFRVPAFR